ncbi:MAG TPA: LuxR C-terminal-related transcriptional regulator [Chryseosolibacter sp.]|nr:LuxR C-terminal-related transcriptional regulator [Chryseosolibacter sp.]
MQTTKLLLIEPDEEIKTKIENFLSVDHIVTTVCKASDIKSSADTTMVVIGNIHCLGSSIASCSDNKPIRFIIYGNELEHLFNFALRHHVVKSFFTIPSLDKEVRAAVTCVCNGGYYFPEESVKFVQHSLYPWGRRFDSLPFDLTAREVIIINKIIEGYTSREIGEVISRSYRTVEDIREKLYRKFSVTKKEQFIAKAIEYLIANNRIATVDQRILHS